MSIDFYLLKVKPERMADAVTATGKPKRGLARIVFLDVKDNKGNCNAEVYDLRGKIATSLQFLNWTKREFGYLRYEVDFG